MIILSDDIIFRKAVIHLLNVELGKFAPAQDLFMMQPDVIELVRKQVCYLLNSDELKAADWNTKEPVFQKLEHLNWIIIIMETRSGSGKRWSKTESPDQNQERSLSCWMNLWSRTSRTRHWQHPKTDCLTSKS